MSDVPDLNAFWMPYTANREFKRNPRLIAGASGTYFYTPEGRQVFDTLSGLWCTGLGHCRPELTAAISKQLSELDYAPAFQFGHPKAFELANRIVELTPGDLNRVFYTNSGSEAADTALKIARAYWRTKGKPTKTKLIGREKGYHGVNFGGMSVGGIGLNRKMFGPALDADHLPHTQMPEHTFVRGQPEEGAHLADQLLNLINLHDASNIAAVIVEPIAGSAGVIVPPRGYLQRLRQICDQHDILLIFDEVITAFGRTGNNFGAQTFDVVPDILNVAKQLTNGVIPLGAVIVREGIYDAFMDIGGPDYMLELPHGYTYSGHPVACAAALATLDLLKSEAATERVRNLAPYFEEAVHQLRSLKHVTDVRNFGLAAGITIAPAPGEFARRPFDISMRCWEKGYYVRYGGDTIALAPPFITEREDLDRMISVIAEVIEATP